MPEDVMLEPGDGSVSSTCQHITCFEFRENELEQIVDVSARLMASAKSVGTPETQVCKLGAPCTSDLRNASS